MVRIKYVMVNQNFRVGAAGLNSSVVLEKTFEDNVDAQKWMMEVINEVQGDNHIKILKVESTK